jgi:hypothetical protein
MMEEVKLETRHWKLAAGAGLRTEAIKWGAHAQFRGFLHHSNIPPFPALDICDKKLKPL